MAIAILNALFPVFSLILLGVICGRTNLLGERAFEVLNRFVITITLPVLTFRSIATMDVKDLAQPWLIAAVVGGALATYALAFGIERRLGYTQSEANIAGLCACFSNTGFIGLPVALLTFGPVVIGPVAVTMLLYSAIVFTLGVIMNELCNSAGQNLRSALLTSARSVSRNPLIIGAVLGVIFCVADITAPTPIDQLLATIAQATAPCALTAVGIFIALPRRKTKVKPIARSVTMKLAVHPIITAGFILLLPAMPSLSAKMAILMAAMPCGSSSFILAGKAGEREMELSAWSVTLTSSLAAISLIIVLFALGVEA